MPYLCLKYAGGSVINTSTNGRSTTSSSFLLRKSQHSMGRYCVIILQSLQCRSSSSSSPTLSLGLSSSSLLRFFLFPDRTKVTVSSVALNIHVDPQKSTYLVVPSSPFPGSNGSNSTPKTASCALVSFLGKLDARSLPQIGNCLVSTSYIWMVLLGNAMSSTEGCIGSKVRHWTGLGNVGSVVWCYF